MELIEQFESLLSKVVEHQPDYETEIVFRFRKNGKLKRFPIVRYIGHVSKKNNVTAKGKMTQQKVIYETVIVL